MSNLVRVSNCTSLTEPTWTTGAFLRTASMKLRIFAAIIWLVSVSMNRHPKARMYRTGLFVFILTLRWSKRREKLRDFKIIFRHRTGQDRMARWRPGGDSAQCIVRYL